MSTNSLNISERRKHNRTSSFSRCIVHLAAILCLTPCNTHAATAFRLASGQGGPGAACTLLNPVVPHVIAAKFDALLRMLGRTKKPPRIPNLYLESQKMPLCIPSSSPTLKELNSAPHLYEGEPRSLYSGEPTRARGVETGTGKETTNTNVSREADTGSGYSGNSGVPERVSHYVMTHPYIFSPKCWSVDTDIEGIQQILDDDHKDEQTIPSSMEHENKQFLHGGYCYREKNYAGAAADFRIAAGQGHAGAQCILGICYFNGVGVNTSKTEAVGWFIRSAEQGFARAQFSLPGKRGADG